MSQKPEISVIVATYNRNDLLTKALKSIDEQSLSPEFWEAIIVSDGYEEAFEIVEYFIDAPNIYYICLPRRYCDVGSTPKNVGIALAHGKYIAYLDDDNEYLPNHLELLYNLIKEKDVDFVWCSTVLRYASDPGVNKGIRNTIRPYFGGIDTSEIIHKKSLIDRFGGWHNTDFDDVYPWGKPTGKHGTDWELVNRWLKGGATWATHSTPTLIYNFKDK